MTRTSAAPALEREPDPAILTLARALARLAAREEYAAMRHGRKKTERGMHFCFCGAAWETDGDLAAHVAAYAAADRAAAEPPRVAAAVKAHAPALTAHREKRR